MWTSGFHHYIEKNHKWREFYTNLTELMSVKLHIKHGKTLK